MNQLVRVPWLVGAGLGAGRKTTKTQVEKGGTFCTLDVRQGQLVLANSTFTHLIEARR